MLATCEKHWSVSCAVSTTAKYLVCVWCWHPKILEIKTGYSLTQNKTFLGLVEQLLFAILYLKISKACTA